VCRYFNISTSILAEASRAMTCTLRRALSHSTTSLVVGQQQHRNPSPQRPSRYSGHRDLPVRRPIAPALEFARPRPIDGGENGLNATAHRPDTTHAISAASCGLDCATADRSDRPRGSLPHKALQTASVKRRNLTQVHQRPRDSTDAAVGRSEHKGHVLRCSSVVAFTIGSSTHRTSDRPREGFPTYSRVEGHARVERR